VAARRASALADFVAEHGDRGLRALGGRRAAMKVLDEHDAGLDVATLVERLEERAGVAG
jgi:LAO/AO transport system kinase